MITHEESTTLLDSTMGVLEGNPDEGTPQTGAGIIDQWLAYLNQAENATELVNSLEQVKTQLRSDQINPQEFSDLLNTLATQTLEFSTRLGSEGDMAPRLEGVSSALKSLAGQVGNQ